VSPTTGDKRVVVVTGASTGIGLACVETLIDAGFFVFGSVRREEDAVQLQEKFGDDVGTLLFDILDDAAIDAAAQIVAARLDGGTLAGLVNNAGVAFPGPLLHLPMEDFRRQIAINLTGQVKVIQAFAPLLGAGDEHRAGAPGRIVNMSSVAGRFAKPFMGAYNASKFGLEGLSDALRRELVVYGVDVVVIQPGMIATPIWDKLESVDLSLFNGTIYETAARRVQAWAVDHGRAAPPASRVAEAVRLALCSRRPPARIAVVKNWLTDYFLPPLLPTRLSDWLVARWLGFDRLRAARRIDK
jgi:NAD(P)-dependent dehydrogenase (short-subunit alcohol dehydrogenase family)